MKQKFENVTKSILTNNVKCDIMKNREKNSLII